MKFYTSIPEEFFQDYAVDSHNFMEKLENRYFKQDWMRFFDEPLEQALSSDVLSLPRDVDYIVSIGVGGSFIGLQSLVDFVNQSEKWLFLGPSLDGFHVQELISKLRGKSWGALIVSKSGTTFEVQLFTELLKAELSQAEWVIGVSSSREFIKNLQERLGVPVHFVKIPQNTGGRYSLLSPLGVLCLFLLSQPWEDLYPTLQTEKQLWLEAQDKHPSFFRGTGRFLLQKLYGVKIEMLSTKDRQLCSLICWVEQLFSEGSGKQSKGIYLSRLFYPRDAHSVGQIMAQGPRIVAETFYLLDSHPIPSERKKEEFDISDLNKFGDTFIRAIQDDRMQRDVIVQSYHIEPNILDLFRVFFSEMLSVSLESYLMQVNPFDQPGVESYKETIRSRSDLSPL